MTELKDFIEKHGVKQTRIAEITGIDDAALSKICRGKRDAKDDEKIAIVAALIECTGKPVTTDDLWPPSPVAEKV